eukprot:s488_g19.t1
MRISINHQPSNGFPLKATINVELIPLGHFVRFFASVFLPPGVVMAHLFGMASELCWRSVRPGKSITWTEEEVDTVARRIVAHMPVSLLTLISDDEVWKGGPLLDLPESKGVKTPTAREISKNYCFIKPVVIEYPCKVLPAYLMTDVWLFVDKLLDRKLFKPTPPKESRMSLAGVEGLKN